MKQRPRIHYTESQKALMWERWQKGESLRQIVQLFDRNHSSIQPILAVTGGIRPAPRCRSRWALTLAEREAVRRGGCGPFNPCDSSATGSSARPRSVGRSSATVAKRATEQSQADQSAWDRARRPKTGKLAQNRALARLVAGKLQRQWSPEQVAGWSQAHVSADDDEPSGVTRDHLSQPVHPGPRRLKKELVAHLRRTRVMRRSRHHTQKTDHHGRITDTVSISERPASVEDRAVPGHWEGDLLFGSKNSQIATLVERQSRYVMLARSTAKIRRPSSTPSSSTRGSYRTSSTNR